MTSLNPDVYVVSDYGNLVWVYRRTKIVVDDYGESRLRCVHCKHWVLLDEVVLNRAKKRNLTNQCKPCVRIIDDRKRQARRRRKVEEKLAKYAPINALVVMLMRDRSFLEHVARMRPQEYKTQLEIETKKIFEREKELYEINRRKDQPKPVDTRRLLKPLEPWEKVMREQKAS